VSFFIFYAYCLDVFHLERNDVYCVWLPLTEIGLSRVLARAVDLAHALVAIDVVDLLAVKSNVSTYLHTWRIIGKLTDVIRVAVMHQSKVGCM